MAKNTMANRCGLDLKIYTYTADGVIENEETPLAVINFANEVSIELTSDMVWATGGKEHNKIVGFNKIWDCGLVRYIWKRNEEVV